MDAGYHHYRGNGLHLGGNLRDYFHKAAGRVRLGTYAFPGECPAQRAGIAHQRVHGACGVWLGGCALSYPGAEGVGPSVGDPKRPFQALAVYLWPLDRGQEFGRKGVLQRWVRREKRDQ